MILIINQNHQSELVASSLVIIPNLHMPIKKYTIHQQKDKVEAPFDLLDTNISKNN